MTMIADIRQALRTFGRNPGFVFVAVLTLGLGISANTALFSVADAVLFKPLVYPSPDRIVRIEAAPMRMTKTGFTASRALEQSAVFEGAGIFIKGGLNVGGEPYAERVVAAGVSAGFFPAMGTSPLVGRPFTQEESLANARVAIVGESLWRRRLAADPALGRTLVLNGSPYTVIGVMPSGYDFPAGAEVWIPPGADLQLAGGASAPETIARMAPGVTLRQAELEAHRIKYPVGETPGPGARPVKAISLREELTGRVRPLFGMMAAAVALVLLVSCMNVANLLLARVSARQREIAIRRALGASRAHLARYLLSESLLIACLAGIIAIPMAMWALTGMRLLLPAGLHGADAIAIDGRAAVFTAALCLAATALFGLVPVLSARGLSGSLRAGTATASPFWRRFRGALVAGQLAAALILLAGSITLVKTVAAALRVDLGARGENVLTLQLTLPTGRYATSEQILSFADRLERQLRMLPKVQAVGMSNRLPGSREVATGSRVDIEGLERPPDSPVAMYLRASPDHFRTVDLPVLAGRAFTAADHAGAPRVVMVSEAIARAYGLEPSQLLGRRFAISFSGDAYAEIVGVVRDVRFAGPDAAAGPQYYVPLAQSPPRGTLYVAVKTSGDPRLAMADARAAVASVDADLPPYNVRTFDEIRASYLADRRFAMVLMLAFAVLTGVLAALGLYGVMSYLVQLRAREIGIRVTLGATPGGVLREVMRDGLWYVVPGIVAGAGLSALLLRLSISRVPGLQQPDLATLGASAACMLSLAVGALLVPARLAARIDPITALKQE